MADKLRQLVSQFVEFVDGERPTATKFNALSAQTRRGFEALEYAIGDIQNQSWANSTAMLTVPYGTKWHQPLFLASIGNVPAIADYEEKKKVIGASDLGRPLDIVNLGRLIGPSSNLNPQVLTQGPQLIQELICEADDWATMNSSPHTSHKGKGRNQYALRYPPAMIDGNTSDHGSVISFNGGSAFSVFATPVLKASDLKAEGEYHVSPEGLITTFSPMTGPITCEYTIDSLQWGGGSSYFGSTFNVIPDPNQLIATGGEGVGVTGPTLDGSYMLTLPLATHQQKNFTGSETELRNEQDYNSNIQLTLPEWLTGTDGTGQSLFQPGDVIPQGSIYLKCIDTNEIYNDAQYVYDTPTTLQIKNIDLGDNGCGLTFCLITVGTDITTSIDDIRRKQFQHSHDRRFGEPFIHIKNIIGQLDQGDGDSRNGPIPDSLFPGTSLSGPYYPTHIPCDYFPQYMHRDGFRFAQQDLNSDKAPVFSTLSQNSSESSNANALRGSLILGARAISPDGNQNSGSDMEMNFGSDLNTKDQRSSDTPGNHGATYKNASGETIPSYLSSSGETFHLAFGHVPAHTAHSVGAGGSPASIAESKVRSDSEPWTSLSKNSAQIYRNHFNELRIEGQLATPSPEGSLTFVPDPIAKEYRFNSAGVDGTAPAKWAGSIWNPTGWPTDFVYSFPGNGEELKAFDNPLPRHYMKRGLGLYSAGGIVLDNMTHASDTGDADAQINEGIRFFSNCHILANAKKDFSVAAKKDILLHSDDGNVAISASPGSVGGTNQGRMLFSGRRFGFNFDQGLGIPNQGSYPWLANYIQSSALFNITSGTTPKEDRGGGIAFHAVTSGTSIGRIVLSTAKCGKEYIMPTRFFGNHDPNENIYVNDNEEVLEPANITLLVQPNAFRSGVTIWDPSLDMAPGKCFSTGEDWDANGSDARRYPSNASLWVKRRFTADISDQFVTVIEDSGKNYDGVLWDSNPGGGCNWTNRAHGNTVLLADYAADKLGVAHYPWLSFMSRSLGSHNDTGIMGSIRSSRGGDPSGSGCAGHYWQNDFALWIGVNNASPTPTTYDHDSHQGDAGSVKRGQVQYVSGGADYAEALAIGNKDEWLIGMSDENRNSALNQKDLGIPEGYVVRVRGGKAYRDGEGTPMLVSKRAVVVGNESDDIKSDHHLNCSFTGQVPCYIMGKAKDNDLVIPVKDKPWCEAVSKETATFNQYKNAIGTIFSKIPEDRNDNLPLAVICATGIK